MGRRARDGAGRGPGRSCAILLELKLCAGIISLPLLVASPTLTSAMSCSGSYLSDSKDDLAECETNDPEDKVKKEGYVEVDQKKEGHATVHPGSPMPDSEGHLAECQSNDPEHEVKSDDDVEDDQEEEEHATVYPGCALLYVPLMPETINDTRFEEKPESMSFFCDRCGTTTPSFEGDYQARKIALSNQNFRRRWEAGENFLWYCFPCLAITEGKRVTDMWRLRGTSLKAPHPYWM